jgi:hypothetical protein
MASIVGSLFKCDSVSAAFRCCEKNIVYMGEQLGEEAKEHFQGFVAGSGGRLSDMLAKKRGEVEGHIIARGERVVRAPKSEVASRTDDLKHLLWQYCENQTDNIARVLDRVVEKHFSSASAGEKEDRCRLEGRLRLHTAAAIRGIDLDGMFERGEALTQGIKFDIHGALREIALYENGAASLWRLMKSRDINTLPKLVALRNRNVISSKQYDIIQATYDSSCDRSFLRQIVSADSFADLQDLRVISAPEIRAMFIDCAKLFSKDYLRRISTEIQLWSQTPEERHGILRRDSTMAEFADDIGAEGKEDGDIDDEGATPTPPASTDSPRISVGENLRPFIARLTDESLRTADWQIPLLQQATMRKLRACCKLSGVSIADLKTRSAERSKVRSLWSRIEKMRAREAAMCYIFDVINDDNAASLSDQRIGRRAKWFIDDLQPDFFERLADVGCLFELHSDDIITLYRIAARMSEDRLAAFSTRYNQLDWIPKENPALPAPPSSPTPPAVPSPRGPAVATRVPRPSPDAGDETPVSPGIAEDIARLQREQEQLRKDKLALAQAQELEGKRKDDLGDAIREFEEGKAKILADEKLALKTAFDASHRETMGALEEARAETVRITTEARAEIETLRAALSEERVAFQRSIEEFAQRQREFAQAQSKLEMAQMSLRQEQARFERRMETASSPRKSVTPSSSSGGFPKPPDGSGDATF